MIDRQSAPYIRFGTGISRGIQLTAAGLHYVGGSKRAITVPARKLRFDGPVLSRIEVTDHSVTFYL